MDIAGLSTNLKMIDTQSRVGTAILSKAMETHEALGAGLVEMMDAAALERSVNPDIGGNVDLRI